MSKFRDKIADVLAVMGCAVIAMLIGCGFMAWSVAYWIGTNREADRFITSIGPGGFVVKFIAPIIALIPLIAGAAFITEVKINWFLKAILLITYASLCVTIIIVFARRGLVW
jgi:hypothetical protein